MKDLLNKVINLYNAHGKFYIFVHGLEGAVIGAIVTWDGGVPNTKAEWLSLGSAVGLSTWAFIKQYLITRQAQAPKESK